MKKVWILVFVKRGFIQEPEIYFDELSAEKRKMELLVGFNRDYDEIDVFEKSIQFQPAIGKTFVQNNKRNI